MSTVTKDEEIAALKHLLFNKHENIVDKHGKGALAQIGKASGAFKRKDAVFRDVVAKDGGSFPPESGRYVLYIAYACPWASRCLTMLYLKGLEKHIEVCVVHPTWQFTRPGSTTDRHSGWVFRPPESKFAPMTNTAGHGSFSSYSECTKDTVLGCDSIRDIYETQKEKETHTYSVPIFFDRKSKLIVSNESAIIIRFLNSAFDDLEGVRKDVNLIPAGYEEKMKEVDPWVYSGINNGVYRCGFAKVQKAYEDAFQSLYQALDKAEDILSKKRYICGSKLCLSDVRLFVTLIRFDEVYAVYFKCNGKLIREYPNLFNYTRELYQIPAFKRAVNMPQIKGHYYTSHPIYNVFGVVPLGPGGLKMNRYPDSSMDIYEQPHGRGDMLSKCAKHMLFYAVLGIGSIAGAYHLGKKHSK